jgi:hypothetical protein
VGTTSELRIDVGQPVPAVAVPLSAASVRGSKASVFVVENGVARARTVDVLGEISGTVFLDPVLEPGSFIVTEGRALLGDGDKVVATQERSNPSRESPATPASSTAVGSAP